MNKEIKQLADAVEHLSSSVMHMGYWGTTLHEILVEKGIVEEGEFNDRKASVISRLDQMEAKLRKEWEENNEDS